LARQTQAEAEYYGAKRKLRLHFDRELIRTGIPLIDRQHEAYADLVDRVFALCAEPQVPRGAMVAAVSQTLSYAMEHFDCEEQLMRSAKYPHYDEHVARHNVFREQAEDFAAELAAEPLAEDFTVRLARQLVNWFCEHVQAEDLRLAVFLRKTGKAPAS
jgi:hemerythrin